MLRYYPILLTGVLILFLVCTRTPAFGKETSESTKSEKKAKDTTHTLQDSPDGQKGGVPEMQAENETPKEARVKGRKGRHVKGRIVQSKPNKCPDCGSIRIARIIYGLPDEELKKAVKESMKEYDAEVMYIKYMDDFMKQAEALGKGANVKD